MAGDYPTFDDAVDRFRSFLTAQGWPASVRWVPPGGVVFVAGKIFVRTVPAARGDRIARKSYRRAVRRRLGVCLQAIARRRGTTYGHVASPADRDAQERLLVPDGLKLSVAEPRQKVAWVSNPIAWTWRTSSAPPSA